MTFIQPSQMPTISSNTSHMNFSPLFGMQSLHSRNSKQAGRPSATHQDTCFTRMQLIVASQKSASITVSLTRSLPISLHLVHSFYLYKLAATYNISTSPPPILQACVYQDGVGWCRRTEKRTGGGEPTHQELV